MRSDVILPLTRSIFSTLCPNNSAICLPSGAGVKHTVGQKHVAVGIVSQKIAEGLDGVDRSGTQLARRRRWLQIFADRLPGTTAQRRQPLSVVQEIPPQDLGNAQHHVPVRHGLDDVSAEPLTEFHHALLVARWAKMASFTGKAQQVRVAAFIAADPGETVFQHPTLQIPVDHLLDIVR